MKKSVLFVFSVLSIHCFAQNNIPEIEILSVDVDAVAQQVTVNYLLDDADGDECEIWLKFSIDGGTFFETVTEVNLSGDAGDGISPSTELSLVWNYAGLTSGIGDTHIRLFASDHKVVDISEMVDQVDEAQLLSILEFVEGERHYTAAPDHLADVRTLMMDAFEDAGLQTEGHDFVYSGADMENIIGRQAGAKDEAITFIIDGHFDGVPNSPGADDNGSAVAGVLEALRILSQYSFEHSIRFIGFDAEELGLIGSQRYVQNGIKPFEDIQGVLNYEMIGFYSDEPNSQTLPEGFNLLFPAATQEVADDDYRGNFLFVCGNVASNPLLAAYMDAAETYVPELRVISAAVPGTGAIAPDLRRSDHARFWDADMQALMLTDASEFRNYNYHTPGDTLGTLDFEFMKNVVKATVAAAAELAIPISANYDGVDLSTIVSVHDHDHTFPAEVRIFPNPSNGFLSLEVSNANHEFRSRINVFDLSGKQVHREVLSFPSGNSTTVIDLQGLPAGAYILVMDSGEAQTSISFIVGK